MPVPHPVLLVPTGLPDAGKPCLMASMADDWALNATWVMVVGIPLGRNNALPTLCKDGTIVSRAMK